MGGFLLINIIRCIEKKCNRMTQEKTLAVKPVMCREDGRGGTRDTEIERQRDRERQRQRERERQRRRVGEGKQ